MFSSMLGLLTAAAVLSAVVMLAAVVAEGRGRHILRLLFGVRERGDADQVFAPVARDEDDWSLVTAVDSTPDRAAPGTRAVTWAKDTASRVSAAATDAVRADAASAARPPRTGELTLSRR